MIITRTLTPAGLTLFLATLFGSPAFAQQATVEAIVAANYPTSKLSPQDVADRRSCHQIMATTAGGAPSRIAAGYTDTAGAVLRVLERNASGVFQVTYESPNDLIMLGTDCTITLVDMDGDGRNDLFFELIEMRGTNGWVFRSTPSGLVNVTPMSGEPGQWDSVLDTPGLIDVYHDGTWQLLTVGGGEAENSERVTELPALYRFSRGKMRLDARVLLAGDFRVGDSPFVRRASFAQRVGGAGPYVLRIINGDRAGRYRASGVSIRINDALLPGTRPLTKETEFLELPIPMKLRDYNTIEVVASGAKDGYVTVVIRKRTQ